VLEEVDGVDGLGEELEVMTAGARAGEDFDGGGLSADEDDAGFGAEFANGDGGFYAVERGHEDVGEKDGGLKAAGSFDGVAAVIYGLGAESAADENLDDGVGDEAFVVDDEDKRIFTCVCGDVAIHFRGREGRMRRGVTGEMGGMHLGPNDLRRISPSVLDGCTVAKL
jgi:hypothetical protein